MSNCDPSCFVRVTVSLRRRWLVWSLVLLSFQVVEGLGLADDKAPKKAQRFRKTCLFAFDNVSIPYTHNLRLSMHHPTKHPDNPVVRRGGPGSPDEFGVQFYGSVIHDGDRFRMWYVAIDPELGRNPTCVNCLRPAYAESKDGIHWTKPKLGLVEYRGSKANNLVRMDPAPLGLINLKVLRDVEDPEPSRRYKMTAHTWWWDGKRRGRGTLAPLFSADGLRWRLAIDARPTGGLLPIDKIVLPRHHFEAAGGLYKWRGMFYATGQGDPGHGTGNLSGRLLLIHRSPDFIHWSQTAHVGFARQTQFRSFPYGQGEETHEGVSVWNRGNVLLGLSGIWHGGKTWKDRTIDLGFLVSNDGAHFREPARDWAFLKPGSAESWDRGGLLQGQGFENVGDQTLIWYGAWDLQVGTNYQPRGGVGLATLPRDRFGSLSVRNRSQPATLISTITKVDGRPKIFLNVAGLSKQAKLRVELLDQQERPIPGFSRDDAVIVERPGFRVPVVWKSKFPPDKTGKTFRIRVVFDGQEREQIELFAIYVEA